MAAFEPVTPVSVLAAVLLLGRNWASAQEPTLPASFRQFCLSVAQCDSERHRLCGCYRVCSGSPGLKHRCNYHVSKLGQDRLVAPYWEASQAGQVCRDLSSGRQREATALKHMCLKSILGFAAALPGRDV